MADHAPPGLYRADPNHSSVLFRIKHLGLSWYTGRFTRVGAELDFDADHPERMAVRAAVELASVAMAYGGTDKDWDKEMAESDAFFDAERAPTAAFASTRLTPTGDTTADVLGDLTFRGHTHPLTLTATFNGAMLDHPSGAKMIGFSAHGVLQRSDYGLVFGLGPRMPDDVQLVIETELAHTGPVA